VRIGIGFDAHRLVEGRPLVLGGVDIPHPRGLEGHSDADVLVHALMDAILSAMREGDIGELFPDTDPAFENASSIGLLESVASRMVAAGFRLVDADMVVVAEGPRIAPHREKMRRCIAGALGVGIDAIGLKGTTTEGLGFTGREDGIAAYAVVLLERATS
jgi:2-C-methyl-D-erythritol 2,4-cyclodiphosphate synthase